MSDEKKPNGKPDKRKLSAFDRIVAMAMGDNRTLGLDSDPAKERCPQLWEFLSTIYVGRDRIVTPSKVSIQMGPEGCLVSLQVRDLAHGMNVSCPHLDQWADALEAALASPNPPWIAWGKKEPTLRKRKTGN